MYLGVDETRPPTVTDAPGHEIAEKYPGEAYFSIDVTPDNQAPKYNEGAQKIVDGVKAKGLEFLNARIRFSLSDKEAPIFAMARSFTDWNLRNVVCCLYLLTLRVVLSSLWTTNECFPASVKVNLVSVWAGSKRTCPPSDLAEEEHDGRKKPACISANGIHNFSYPRTGILPIGRLVDGQIRLSSLPYYPKMVPKLFWVDKRDFLLVSSRVSPGSWSQVNLSRKPSVERSGKKAASKWVR